MAAVADGTDQPPLVIALSGLAGCLVSCLWLTATLLKLSDGPGNGGGGWRRELLDGLLAGDAVFSWCWTLLLMNHFGLLQLASWRGTAGAALALLCLVSGVAFVSVVRSRRPRGRVILTAISLTLVAATGVLLTIAVIEGWHGSWTALTAAPAAVGCLLLAATVGLPATAELSTPAWPMAPFGAGPTYLAVTAISTSAIIQAIRIQSLDLGIVMIGIPMASLFGLRVALALRDARRSALQLAEREIAYWRMANVDPLTGLANRRRLRQALEEMTGADGRQVDRTLIVFDLDGFKDINDLNGHDVGDCVLVEVGSRLLAVIRPADLAVRLGGDEFAVLMIAGPAEARAIAEQLLVALCRPYEVGGGTVHLSASIGFAGSGTAEDTAGMMRNADHALRRAKQRGKRRVEAFDIRYDRTLQRRLAIEHDLRGSGKRNELTLVYQPVVALPSGRTVGVEALLRWQHPVFGLISPVEFVPIAEEAGLIGELGGWVANQACQQLSRWRSAGHDLWMSVNVSPRELRSPRYQSQIIQILRRYSIPPRHLVLELTESAVAQDSKDLASALRGLREAGVRIALDDFGSGYSSLGQLRRLEVDILKIDRELVVEPPRGPTLPGAPLIDVIVSIGQRFGLDVIAEGVENPGQRDVVERAGCTLCQGFLFAQPMPAEHVEAMLLHGVVARAGHQ